MKVNKQRNEGTYLPRSVTGCRSQGLIRSTSPVSHLKTPQIVNISIEHILSPGASCSKQVDSAIRWINHYPLDSAVGFPNTYPMDSGLSN